MKMSFTYTTVSTTAGRMLTLTSSRSRTLVLSTRSLHSRGSTGGSPGSADAATPLAVLALSPLRLVRPRATSVERAPLRPPGVVPVALVRGAVASSSSCIAPASSSSSCSAAAARATAAVVPAAVACRGAARCALGRAREAALHQLGGEVAVHEHGQPWEADVTLHVLWLEHRAADELAESGGAAVAQRVERLGIGHVRREELPQVARLAGMSQVEHTCVRNTVGPETHSPVKTRQLAEAERGSKRLRGFTWALAGACCRAGGSGPVPALSTQEHADRANVDAVRMREHGLDLCARRAQRVQLVQQDCRRGGHTACAHTAVHEALAHVPS